MSSQLKSPLGPNCNWEEAWIPTPWESQKYIYFAKLSSPYYGEQWFFFLKKILISNFKKIQFNFNKKELWCFPSDHHPIRIFSTQQPTIKHHYYAYHWNYFYKWRPCESMKFEPKEIIVSIVKNLFIFILFYFTILKIIFVHCYWTMISNSGSLTLP